MAICFHQSAIQVWISPGNILMDTHRIKCLDKYLGTPLSSQIETWNSPSPLCSLLSSSNSNLILSIIMANPQKKPLEIQLCWAFLPSLEDSSNSTSMCSLSRPSDLLLFVCCVLSWVTVVTCCRVFKGSYSAILEAKVLLSVSVLVFKLLMYF